MDANELRQRAQEAYIFAYPLVVMGTQRQVMTSVSSATSQRAPINQFAHFDQLPDASYSDVVTINVDTLNSFAWLDLSEEPLILSVPHLPPDRFYVMQLIDAWTEGHYSPGTRRNNNQEEIYALVGPDWEGSLPQGVRRIPLPTNMAAILGHIQVNGHDDIRNVGVLQQKFDLRPLSAYGKTWNPPSVPVENAADTEPPVDQIAHLDAPAFFEYFTRLWNENPPSPADAPQLERLAPLGLIPGQDFDFASLPAEVQDALQEAVPAAQKILANAINVVPHVTAHAWTWRPNTGRFGTNYLHRAFTASVGLGASQQEDAIYWRLTTDEWGQPLSGDSRYIIQFEPGQTPPVQAFWSITLYNSKYLLTENALNRYSIGNRNTPRLNHDGSLDIYIQHDSPGEELESNWLPSPQGGFMLLMRQYLPRPDIIRGEWSPPGMRKVG